jgi:hypothetical protein
MFPVKSPTFLQRFSNFFGSERFDTAFRKMNGVVALSGTVNFLYQRHVLGNCICGPEHLLHISAPVIRSIIYLNMPPSEEAFRMFSCVASGFVVGPVLGRLLANTTHLMTVHPVIAGANALLQAMNIIWLIHSARRREHYYKGRSV